MKRGLIVFLAVFAFAIAMVPRDKRAVNTEEEEEILRSQSTTTTTSKPIEIHVEICAPRTPCGWSVYKPYTKYIALNITNTYCKCTEGTQCQVHEDDQSINAFVLRCRPPQQAVPEDASGDS